jgi:hypothetical protein
MLSFNAGHISFTNNVVSLVNKLGINNVTIRSIKKHSHPLIIFHKGLNVSAELSPIVRAKIPADRLFRAVHSQIFFFITHKCWQFIDGRNFGNLVIIWLLGPT